MRQQAIGRNIANVDTPGYQAETVNFEDALKSKLEGGTKLKMATTDTAHLAAPSQSSADTFDVTQRVGGSERADGNNVDIDVEMTDMVSTGVQYQAVAQSVSKQLQLLKTIASS